MNLVFVVILVACTDWPSCSAIQINFVKIPAAVQNNSGTPAILDCDYTLRPGDEGLVVKWFLNEGIAAVYQWIPPHKPQDLGVLKDRLDLTYKASDDPQSAHRALKIINPTTDLAGEYKCFVSTFSDEDFSSKQMIVFEPEEHLTTILGVPFNDSVNFTCQAIGVYPEPKLVLYRNSEEISETKMEFSIVEWIKSRHPNGRYDYSIVTSTPISELTPGDIIDCEMRIPGTGYVKKKSFIYYPPIPKHNSSSTMMSLIHVVLVMTMWMLLFI